MFYVTCRIVIIAIYSRNCFLPPPLGAAKTSLKRQVDCKMRVAKTGLHVQSQHLSSPLFPSRRHFPRSPNTLAAVYTDILLLSCLKFTQKVVPSLHNQGYMCTALWSHTQVHLHVNGFVRAKSGGCWSRSEGRSSPQKLFCTK